MSELERLIDERRSIVASLELFDGGASLEGLPEGNGDKTPEWADHLRRNLQRLDAKIAAYKSAKA